MQKKKKLNNQPSQNEMSELEKLFNLNELDTLERKAKELISKYSKLQIYIIFWVLFCKEKKNSMKLFSILIKP